MKIFDYLEPKKQKKLWEKLKAESFVPVVNSDDYKSRKEILKNLREEIEKNNYFPKLLHGYLGSCKKIGSTRFIPILQKEDFAVYYACTAALQNELLNDKIKGVYGGWRMTSGARNVVTKDYYADYVLDSSLSTKLWLKNWQDYTSLLQAYFEQNDDSLYVQTTDIANFYDNIDLYKLEQKIKKHVQNWDETVDVLMHFLKYWNRLLNGYNPSFKGIPQEFVQDASRILANFYLQEFDKEIKNICEEKEVEYLRWADDLIFIHKDKEVLENIVHITSKKLLKIGLNLNSSKTKLYTKDSFIRYRCIDILDLFNSNNTTEINKGIEHFKLRLESGEEARKDSVYKRLLTILVLKPNKGQENNIIWNEGEKQNHQEWLKYKLISEGYEMLSIFDGNKLKYLIYLFGNLNEGIATITNIFCSKPYAQPKAALLKVLEKIMKDNNSSEKVYKAINKSIETINKSSNDSTILKDMCIPHTSEVVKKLYKPKKVGKRSKVVKTKVMKKA
jgi:hypothetical protein